MAGLPEGPLPVGPWAEPDLFSDHTITGANHPPTSVYAARLALPRTGSRRYDVLRAIARAGGQGMTDYELHLEMGWNLNSIRPRRKELQDEGWIESSGLTRPTETGAPSIVWRLSQRGHDKWGLG